MVFKKIKRTIEMKAEDLIRPNTEGNWDVKTLNYVEEIESQNKELTERVKELESLLEIERENMRFTRF